MIAGPHRRRVRRARAPTAPGSTELPARGRAGGRRRGRGPGDRRAAATVRARQVINATGVWTDDTQAMAGGRGAVPRPRPPRASTWWCPGTGSTPETGLILRTEKSVLFVIPWGRHWIIGTTDTDWELDKAHPAASRADIDYLLDHVNRVLRTPLTREDVEGVYAGLRPLLSGESDDDQPGSPASTLVGQPGARPGRGRGRQVHHLPGDGQGRRRRGGARALDEKVPPVLHRHRPAASAPTASQAAVELPPPARPPTPGCTSARVEHLLAPLRLAGRRGARPGRATDPTLGEPLVRRPPHDTTTPPAAAAGGVVRRTVCVSPGRAGSPGSAAARRRSRPA